MAGKDLAFSYDCAVTNYAFPAKPDDNVAAKSIAECKDKCKQAVGCTQWTYTKPVGVDPASKNCALSREKQTPIYSKGAISAPIDGRASCTCPAGAVADAAFPPANLAESQKLFNGRAGGFAQPLGLECWPKDDKYNLYSCGEPKLLRSTEVGGWKGTCLGLKEVKLGVNETCQANCKNKPLCSTWQQVTKNQTTNNEGCFQGTGYDCGVSRAGWSSVKAARFQRGEVKVIAPLTDYQLKGLKRVFGTTAYNTTAEGMENCKEVCYSSLLCNAWQYYSKPGQGCYVEAPEEINDHALPYPLILGDQFVSVATDANAKSLNITGGEFIQHYCKEPAPAIPVVDRAASTNKLDYKFDCALTNYEFPGESHAAVPSLAQCKSMCQKDAACSQWSYNTKTKACQLSGGQTTPIYNGASISAPKDGQKGCQCPATPLEGSVLPAANLSESQRLFKGKTDAFAQPLGLQCWPKDANYNLYSCGAPKTLRQTSAGFKGQCKGLSYVNVTGETCEANCIKNPLCSTFAELSEDPEPASALTPAGCYQGVGYDCDKDHGYKVTRAARFQRGDVKVISTVATAKIKSLKKVFGTDAHNTTKESITNCKEVCYSSLLCNAWQYYSTEGTGCYIESPTESTGPVAYPLLVSSTLPVNASVLKIEAGEYIQHYCNQPTPAPVAAKAAATTAAPTESGVPIGVLALAAAVVGLVILGLCYAFACCCFKPVPKKSRGRKKEEAPKTSIQISTPAPAVPLSQPNLMVQSQVMLQSLPMQVHSVVATHPAQVQYAVPQATYSAAPYSTAPAQYAAPMAYAGAPAGSVVMPQASMFQQSPALQQPQMFQQPAAFQQPYQQNTAMEPMMG